MSYLDKLHDLLKETAATGAPTEYDENGKPIWDPTRDAPYSVIETIAYRDTLHDI